jgi:hypothetical protein
MLPVGDWRHSAQFCLLLYRGSSFMEAHEKLLLHPLMWLELPAI